MFKTQMCIVTYFAIYVFIDLCIFMYAFIYLFFNCVLM